MIHLLRQWFNSLDEMEQNLRSQGYVAIYGSCTSFVGRVEISDQDAPRKTQSAKEVSSKAKGLTQNDGFGFGIFARRLVSHNHYVGTCGDLSVVTAAVGPSGYR
ncbi:hypothetical protein [Microvirga sp. VF16]|uniref:hypothetical protein n=1 Tax=Microvirga sp. VF16 TaxID=2807101 RepID=UPI00193E3BC1|nr:hypothetical protein [Microvirga sp. VF16]QRM32828.1 hypothetical protein JO965_26055 [Microvirga sp. VF16]